VLAAEMVAEKIWQERQIEKKIISAIDGAVPQADTSVPINVS
jgi:hypothetical protein